MRLINVTTFVAAHRETLLIADYAAYRAQLSRALHTLRKNLGRATQKREKFAPKPVTVEDIDRSHEFAHLLILTAERAWAHAMQIKTTRADDPSGRGITGSTRSHLLSRLHKAAKTAKQLLELLRASSRTVEERDILESRAYLATLAGAEEFERQAGGQRGSDAQAEGRRWEACLKQYGEARVIYAAILEKEKNEVFRELLANTIDPTIRYAAYQAQLSRTIPIPTVAKKYFPREDKELVKVVESLDEYALKDKPVQEADGEMPSSPQDVPNIITWRGRKANIVDASIGQALANVSLAEARLRSYLASNATASTRDKAAAYDDILIASQDAADATKRATDELEKERTDEGDRRMQDLRMTSLSVNYDLISWRVGRNRILIGEDDGLRMESPKQKKPKHLRKDGSEYPDTEEPRGRKLARLRERVVLYDASIQSIHAIKELPGVMRDTKFVDELEAKANYFRALKCLNISYSHSLLGNYINALALLQRAKDLVSGTLPSSTKDTSLPTLEIDSAASQRLQADVKSLLVRTHALVEMHALESNAAKAAEKNALSAPPLVKRLNDYPVPGTTVNLANLVTYPPKVQSVPVKPIFLDVAFNYIDYPGRSAQTVLQENPQVNGTQQEEPAAQPEKKRGWFGFGR